MIARATDKPVPNDFNAEVAVIGSVILANEALDVISLHADEFYDPRNKVIYGQLRQMWMAGHRAIDGVTLGEALEAAGKLSTAGGSQYVAEACLASFEVVHVRYYADIVAAKAKLRHIIATCEQAARQAHANNDPETVLASLERACITVRESTAVSEIATMNDAVTALEEREANPAVIHATGLIDLDRQFGGGLRDGQCVIVGGRPGGGKSVLATQLAVEFAKRGEPSLVVSLEMPRAEIAYRLAKSIDRQSLRGLPVHIVDTPTDIERTAALIRLANRRDGIRLAVVDYLQLVKSGDSRVPREQQVAEVSRTLKRLAMELEIPVVAACQLNRNTERDGRQPRLSDLRESGAIEQDADIVCLIHRDEQEASIIVAKNRNGSPGKVSALFRPEVFRFENAAIDVGGL